MKSQIHKYEGALFVDDRGELGCVNECDLADARRMYTVRNFRKGFIRAWHGQKIEGKFISVVKGALLLAAVKVDNWENPSKDLKIEKMVLSEKNPSIVFVPGGYAHGHMNLTDETIILVLSTTTMGESRHDDFRFPARYWNPWEIEER